MNKFEYGSIEYNNIARSNSFLGARDLNNSIF